MTDDIPNTGNSPDAGASEMQLELRHAQPSDYADIYRIMEGIYKNMGGSWTEAEFATLLRIFPEGQICIVDGGTLVAAAVSIVVDYDKLGDKHSYEGITAAGKFTTHDNGGDTLYGVDLFVDPKYRGLRLGRRLYDARKELCENLNLRRILIGARISGYSKHSDLRPREYIEAVQAQEIHDPNLSFQLANGFQVRRLVKNYSPDDTASGAYAVLLEWPNIYFSEADEPLFGNRKRVVRVGAVQWQMRSVTSVDELLAQVEYFVGAVAGYTADFVVLPEFFNMPLMALKEPGSDAQGIRFLAGFTEQIRDRIIELAVSYNVNVIAGSMPEHVDGTLYNVAYICRRDGSWASQYKLHITPDETGAWGLQGGNNLVAFDTDIGRVGVLICYDVEFPELSRVLAEEDIEILFVPYWTDTRNGYLRVRHCAAARAIENEMYVVITGSCGNLPKVENMDIQYSQSAVLSPADFAFPLNAVVSEATPNTEMLLIADLDLDLLKDLREQGSVRNRKDRRHDLYKINWKGPVVGDL